LCMRQNSLKILEKDARSILGGRPGLFHFVALRPYYGMYETHILQNMIKSLVGAQCNAVE
ncbi:MAG TPA: hypothetical protein VII61_06715, partial [Ktedonobacteraceae bacterium]